MMRLLASMDVSYGGGDTTGIISPISKPAEMGSADTGSYRRLPSIPIELFFGNPNGNFANGTAALGFFGVRLAMEWTRDNIAAFG
jgi:hypothetical protein